MAVLDRSKTVLNVSTENDIITYTTKDLARILHMGHTQAYALMNSKAFPSMRINRRMLVTKDNLEKWLNNFTGKKFLL